mmetsp:Transcript_11688/g.21565  ORF Transcript_11688/g.21565 Transcript_11688/m.21565 type:complete len:268 (+) Transcript_11688:91-894(+)
MATTVKKMTTTAMTSSSFLDRPIPGLNITTAIALWLVVTTVFPVYYRATQTMQTTRMTWLGISLLGFNNLNILIAVCEIGLGKYITNIQDHYRHLQKTYKQEDRWQAAISYLTLPLSLRTLFDLSVWCQMWSTYSLWDPSYSNRESFGFFIDVGNGYSTILPCILWDFVILFPNSLFQNDNRNNRPYTVLVGMIGACMYWQVLYGTIIYFLSFVFNKRYVGKPVLEISAFVGFTNGIWFVFPILGLYASYQLLVQGNGDAVINIFGV